MTNITIITTKVLGILAGDNRAKRTSHQWHPQSDKSRKTWVNGEVL